MVRDANASDTSPDDANVCLARQRILAAFASEWICVRGGIDPEGTGWIARWEFSRWWWTFQRRCLEYRLRMFQLTEYLRVDRHYRPTEKKTENEKAPVSHSRKLKHKSKR
jgi:hypothetical protein